MKNFQQISQVKYFSNPFLTSGTNQFGTSEMRRLWAVRDRVPRTFLHGRAGRIKETENLETSRNGASPWIVYSRPFIR